MQSVILIGLINNIALLLSLWAIYGLLPQRANALKTTREKILTGLAAGILGMAVMLNPLPFSNGVVFDTRSILLSITGLFFGFIPTLIAVVMTSLYRLYDGGAGAWTGVGVILTSAGIGLAWRYLRHKQDTPTGIGEFYLLGIVVHGAMLLMMFTLPQEMAFGVLDKISLPVMALYPLATVLLGMLFADQLKRKKLSRELWQSREQLRGLSNYLKNALETERTYIARDALENLSQIMAGLKMDLSLLVRHGRDETKQQQRLVTINTLVDQSIETIRRISTDLRPSLLDDLGLSPALEWFTKDFEQRTGISASIELPLHQPDLDPALTTDLFRIYQAVLTNISSHAGATQVEARLRFDQEDLTLEISDNGTGITAEELSSPESLRILEMRERVEHWGGRLEIEAQVGRGTKVTAIFPPAGIRSSMEAA